MIGHFHGLWFYVVLLMMDENVDWSCIDIMIDTCPRVVLCLLCLLYLYMLHLNLCTIGFYLQSPTSWKVKYIDHNVQTQMY